MSVKGVRAKIYQEAQIEQAIYSIKNPKSIWYCNSGENLLLNLLFKKEEQARKFQTFLSMWHMNNPMVVNKDVVSVVELLEEVYVYKSELKYVWLTHYDGEDPVGSLEHYKGSHVSVSSISELSGASMSTHFGQLQSIEKQEEFTVVRVNPYRCHIKGQRAFPALKNNDSNMLALSWLFHQYFDGLNIDDEPSGQIKVPQIAVLPWSREFIEEMVGIPKVS